jgi:hypothetical protein
VLLTYSESHSEIFPSEWKVDEKLVTEFCKETKSGLAEIMRKNERDSEFNTIDMIRALKETRKFEQDKLNVRFKVFKSNSGC